MSHHQNDLLWAEAELRRSGGNLATAAILINNTRAFYTFGGTGPANSPTPP